MDDDDDDDEDFNPYSTANQSSKPVAPEAVVEKAEEYTYKPAYEAPAAVKEEEEVYKTSYETHYQAAPITTSAQPSSKLRFDDEEENEYKP